MKPDLVKFEPRESVKLGWLVGKPRHPLVKHYDPFDRAEDGGFSSDIPLSYPDGTETAPVVEDNIDLYHTLHSLKDGSVEFHALPYLTTHPVVHEVIRIKARSRTTYELKDPRGLWKRIEQAVHGQQYRPGIEMAQEWLRDRDRHAYMVTGLVTVKEAEVKQYHISLGKKPLHGHVSVADIVAVATQADVDAPVLDAIATALGEHQPANLADVKHHLKAACTVVEGKSSKCHEESILLVKCQHIDLKQRSDWINGRLDGKVRNGREFDQGIMLSWHGTGPHFLVGSLIALY
jgi:hypothetical protein